MMNKFRFFYLLFVVFALSCQTPSQKANSCPSITLKLHQIADALQSPVAAVFTPDGLMLVCEQTGKIRVIEKSGLLESPFLDLSLIHI